MMIEWLERLEARIHNLEEEVGLLRNVAAPAAPAPAAPAPAAPAPAAPAPAVFDDGTREVDG
jgi:ribosomal protein L12E/L44/L45/RPP1/RPP2